MISSGSGAAIEAILILLVRFLGEFMTHAGEVVFHDVWTAVTIMGLAVGGLGLLIYMRTRRPKE